MQLKIGATQSKLQIDLIQILLQIKIRVNVSINPTIFLNISKNILMASALKFSDVSYMIVEMLLKVFLK